MDNKSQTAMIALLPLTDEWCKQDLAHLTVVYCGEVDLLKKGDFNSMAKDASSISLLTNPIHLKTNGIETFGGQNGDPSVDVIRIVPSQELLAIRNFLEFWDRSEFKIFKPHVTIGPAGSLIENIPLMISFDRIMVRWGDETLTFWLRRY